MPKFKICTVRATDGRTFQVEGFNVDNVIKRCKAITVQAIYDNNHKLVYERGK